MGYYVTLRYTQIYIPTDLFAPICRHLLSSDFISPSNMSGGCYGGPDDGKKWFSWCDTDKLRTSLEKDDLYGVFECFRFETLTDDDGNIIDLHFDCKCGDEEILFRYLATVLPGVTRLDWQGEGGEQWRWRIANGELVWIDGVTIFPGDEEDEGDEDE